MVHLFQHDILFISIHALRKEGDPFCNGTRTPLKTFLSTPSARRATYYINSLPDWRFISIHALRKEGDSVLSTMPT